MIEIVPAILPKSLDDLEEKLSLIDGLVPMAQIDICEPKIFEKEIFPSWYNFGLEFDLMFKKAEKAIGWLINIRTHRVIFHLNLSPAKEIKRTMKDLGGLAHFGVSLDWENPPNALDPFVGLIDTVQIMGIKKIGFQGESFEESTIEKVAAVRKKYPGLAIGVDGGVNLSNAPKLIKAGATRLIIGSAIWKSDNPKETIEKFKNLE